MTTDTPALQALRAVGLEHEVLSHGPVRSLVEAADARGVEPADVVEALVVRRGEDDHLLVLVPGLRTISWPRLRALLGSPGCRRRRRADGPVGNGGRHQRPRGVTLDR